MIILSDEILSDWLLYNYVTVSYLLTDAVHTVYSFSLQYNIAWVYTTYICIMSSAGCYTERLLTIEGACMRIYKEPESLVWISFNM